jgi:type IV secretory pathway VirB2 component (pilin)
MIGMLMMLGAGIMIAFTEGQAIKRLLWIVVGLGLALNAETMFGWLFTEGGGYLLMVL